MQAAQLMLTSAELTVAQGQRAVGSQDNTANKTNDYRGYFDLGSATLESSLTQPAVDNAFASAIAQAINKSTSGAEVAAIVIAANVGINKARGRSNAAFENIVRGQGGMDMTWFVFVLLSNVAACSIASACMLL